MEQKINKGIFITFEGPEGSGKSTQSKRIYKQLLKDGYDVIYTSEPGSTCLGKEIRKILLKKNVKFNKYSELFLFEADRAEHIQEIILPNLQKNKIILCDRFNTATFAYQGYGLGMDLKIIQKIDSIITKHVIPDITILLDIDIKTGLKRANKTSKADNIEKRTILFHEKVRKGYLSIANKNPKHFEILSALEDKKTIYNSIEKIVYNVIRKNTRT